MGRDARAVPAQAVLAGQQVPMIAAELPQDLHRQALQELLQAQNYYEFLGFPQRY